MRVERVGVVGAGTMGAGIAQLACLGGYRTLLHDPLADALAAGIKRVGTDLRRGAERRRWTTAEADAAEARLAPAGALAELGPCDLVIEAAPEDIELKRVLFAELEGVCSADAVLATNTSSLRVAEIAARMRTPERACGMHFFNPPALMELVEVVAAPDTSTSTIETAFEAARAMGRTPVRAADAIGFIANRCNRPFTLEALRACGEGVAEPDQIDRIVRVGGGYRMGPFETMDLVGIDVNLGVAQSFYEQGGSEPRWEPHELQRSQVEAGRLGRKSGAGFYRYDDGPHRPDDVAPGPLLAIDPGPGGVLETDGFRAVPLETASWDDGGEDVVGYVAVPDIERASLIEIARGARTSRTALAGAGSFFADHSRHVESLPGAAPGLILGRLIATLVNEATLALEAGIAERADIDTAVRLGFNHPRGPFEWRDALGPRRIVSILDALAAAGNGERYRAAASLRAAAG